MLSRVGLGLITKNGQRFIGKVAARIGAASRGLCVPRKRGVWRVERPSEPDRRRVFLSAQPVGYSV